MSEANYKATAHDHAEILISIHSEGNLQDGELKAALAKVRQYSELMIADAGRNVYFRFELNASTQNSEWGYFQPHRRVMGLIVLAGCATAIDVALLHETFQKKKEAYAEFIFDARCFVFGIDNALVLQQSKAEVFQFPNVQSWKSSDRDMKDFLTSIFYILESKRLQILADKSDRPPLLTAPFERNSSNSFDNESKSYRKKSMGRRKKYVADISLLAGLKMEALQNYHSSLDMLISVNDQVWIGGVLEGLCATSAIVLHYSPKSEQKAQVSKSASKQVLDPRNLISSKLAGSSSNDHLIKFCVQKSDDFVDRYKEAVINYSRCAHMGVIEFEACVKATKVMAIMNKPMQAAEFLQNAVYISLKVTDEERILKYSILADLYDLINFHRKSAFYRRVAAMQCVAPQLEQPNWQKCHHLLQGTLKGYNLNLRNDSGLPTMHSDGVNDIISNNFGWPQVRLRVLYELVFSSRRIGNNKLANRIMVYLLMRMYDQLTELEEKEACAALESFAHKSIESHGAKDEKYLSSLNLYTLPTVNDITLQPLSEDFIPVLLNACGNSKSVFLFAPSSYRSHLRHVDFKWCANAPAEVRITVHNPLRVHCLHVAEFKLICETPDEAKFECHTVTLDIPANASVEATLVVVPKAAGTLIITGYETRIFGFSSRCLFADIPWISDDKFEVDILPEIPVLKKDDSFPDIRSKNNNLHLTLYPGEKYLLEIPLNNTSDVPITNMNVDILPPTANEVTSKFKSSSTKSTSLSTSRKKAEWLQVSCFGWLDRLPIKAAHNIRFPVVLKAGGLNQTKLFEPQSCTGIIKIKYAGSQSAKQNWCRNVSVKFIATLKPCFIINDLSIKSVTSPSKQGNCIVSVNLSNVSEDIVMVTSSSNLKMLHSAKDEEHNQGVASITPDESREIKLEIEDLDQKCRMDEVLATSITQGRRKEIGLEMQEKISEYLDLSWKTINRCGSLKISTFRLNRESIINWLRPPLYWDFYFNDELRTNETKCCATVSEAYPVRINLKNVTGTTLTSIQLELEIFQDQGNSFLEWNMEDLVLCVGCQNQTFDEIQPDETVEFACVLVFLLSGHYHVRLHRLSAFRGSLCEYWPENLKRTNSNQASLERLNYTEYSPEIVVVAS